ncbi:MAG: DNA-processing protein DprA [Candidatus Taylorbacteria bacterium]
MKLTTYTITKEHYPRLLSQIPRLPKEMHVAGILPDNTYRYLCIVGSRNNSTYGKEVCDALIKSLQGYPVVIVSGLAIGIDSIVHETALKYNIKTIAFPGSGLSLGVLYPHSRRSLAFRIIEHGGALISPFSMTQEGTHWTFPYRNRLMAGISHATLIIEAGKGSGTLLTAEYATEFNRDVLTVPGSIFSELSYGPHMLICNGATPITSGNDLLEALGFKEHSTHNQQTLPIIDASSYSPLEKQIVDILQRGSHSGSDLIEMTQLHSSAFNMIISELELRSVVTKHDGMYYLENVCR